MKRALTIIFLVLLADQSLKFWIKLNMSLGQSINIAGDWFVIHFVENNGMAFGLELMGPYGKLFLSIFRIVAVLGIGYYLYMIIKNKAPKGLVASISLILAGALGNIIDSAFYGKIFSMSGFHTVAQLFPPEGGYAKLLHGKVVDMLYFPLVDTYWPEWVPGVGGDSLVFFRPVFNLADSAITVGVLLILLFQKRYFIKSTEEEEPQPEASNLDPQSPPPPADTPESSLS